MRFFITTLFFYSIACDLPHDNPLDPKNPDGEATQIVVVENFMIINTKSGPAAPAYNEFARDASYELKDKYEGQLLILEYHMAPADTNYADSLSSSDNDVRYASEYKGSAARAFPHVFFNGKQTAAQGASSLTNAKTRYDAILDTTVARKSKLYCEVDRSVQGNVLTVRSRLIRYGDEPITGIKVEFIVYEDKGDVSGHFTVRKILPSESVTQIDGGSTHELPEKTFTLPAFYNAAQIGVAVIVKDEVSKRILQSNFDE